MREVRGERNRAALIEKNKKIFKSTYKTLRRIKKEMKERREKTSLLIGS